MIKLSIKHVAVQQQIRWKRLKTSADIILNQFNNESQDIHYHLYSSYHLPLSLSISLSLFSHSLSSSISLSLFYHSSSLYFSCLFLRTPLTPLLKPGPSLTFTWLYAAARFFVRQACCEKNITTHIQRNVSPDLKSPLQANFNLGIWIE